MGLQRPMYWHTSIVSNVSYRIKTMSCQYIPSLQLSLNEYFDSIRPRKKSLKEFGCLWHFEL